jgi:hypothetical protein
MRANIVGQKFGRLKVLEYSHTQNKRAYWKCVCDCGVPKTAMGGNLIAGYTSSCGCARNDAIKAASVVNRKRPYESLYRAFVYGQKRRRKGPIEVEISYEQFVEFTNTTKCHYCWREVIWCPFNHSAKGNASYHLDRKDSTLGYTVENCVVCCKDCNYAKQNRYNYFQWYEMTRPWRDGILK